MFSSDAKPFQAGEKMHCPRAASCRTNSTTDDSSSSDPDELEGDADASWTSSSQGDVAEEDILCDDRASSEHHQLIDESGEDYNLRVELPLLQARLNQRLNDGDKLIDLLANVFEHLCRSDQGVQLTPFHSSRIPPVSLLDYVTRMRKYMQCSDACFALALIFIDRVVKTRPGFVVCKANVHRLVATSIVLAAKYHDDVFYSNAYYAKVVGMQTVELNKLESLLLRLLGWRTHVGAEELEHYLCMIMPPAA